MPGDMGVAGANTGKVAVLRDGIDTIAINGWRSTRPTAAVLVERRPNGRVPDCLPVGAIKRKHDAVTTEGPLDIDPVTLQSYSAIASAEISDRPQQLRTALRPRL